MANTYVDPPAKRCRFDDTKFCYYSQCDLISPFGVVSVCGLHPNPDGLLMRRRVAPVCVSIFSKHVVERRWRGF